MRMTLMAAAVAFAASVGSAAAADLGGYAGSVKDDAAYGPTTWAGLYAGASLGYGWGDSEHNYEGDTYSVDSDGTVFGLQLGYNIQRGETVFGVEVSLNGTDLNGSDIIDGDRYSTELDWYAAAVARLGFAFGNNLVYGFGGVAWGDLTTGFEDFRSDATHIGWTAGLGIERSLGGNLSVRLEYAHVDLGEEDIFKAEGCGGCEADASFDVVKLGLNYRFGDRLEALK